jgi:hypothetical protein
MGKSSPIGPSSSFLRITPKTPVVVLAGALEPIKKLSHAWHGYLGTGL